MPRVRVKEDLVRTSLEHEHGGGLVEYVQEVGRKEDK
jgi:hypothetical protein